MSDEAVTLKDLMKRVNTSKPSREDRAAIREYFETHPLKTWHAGIARLAEDSAFDALGNGVIEESTRAAACRLRHELEAESSSVLERLVVDHVILCWITYSNIDFVYSTKTQESMLIAQADYWERRLSSAQRRYLRSLETLARVRRMKLPVLQVNIGEQQVNVAG